MKKLWEKIKGMNIVTLYFITLGAHFLWNITVGGTLYICGAQFSQNVADVSKFTNSFLGIALLPMCAFLEELMFRWLPMIIFFTILGILIKKGKVDDEKRSKAEKYGLATIVIVSSIIFGIVHGNGFNILIQGVSGVIFSMFYLRTLYRRKEVGKKDKLQVMPVLSSTLYHTIANFAMMWGVGIVGVIYSIIYFRRQKKQRVKAAMLQEVPA